MDNSITKTGKAGVVVERVVGFGKFQVLLYVLVKFLVTGPSAFVMLFMSFGNYNPGWRCLDHTNGSYAVSLSASNWSHHGQQIFGQGGDATQSISVEEMTEIVKQNPVEYLKEENCSLFTSCKQIEFDPTSVTIVSEWALLCAKRWIPSIIISIQMAGVLLGSAIAGYIGDACGRKPTIYVGVLGLILLNFVSVFSVSWEMFAALRFLLGFTIAITLTISDIFATEFVPEKWRSVVKGIPAWNIATTLFGVTCMSLKNWRHVHIVTALVALAGFLPVFWIPESLRWLEIKGKSKRFKADAEKVARMNRKLLPSLEELQEMADSSNLHSREDTNKIYNVFHLFKNGYAMYTVLLSVPWLVNTAVNYGLRFGIKALHGNFYTNLIISFTITIPFSVFQISMPDLVGRKKSALIFTGVSAICLLVAGILELVGSSESVKLKGVTTLIFIGKAFSDGIWSVLALYSMELYPTAIRGLGLSWGSTVARIGGMASPFLIPSTNVYISYILMAIVTFVCSGVYLKFPETKKQPLKDTYVRGENVADEDNDDLPGCSADQETLRCTERVALSKTTLEQV